MAYKLGLVGADQHPNRLARYQPAKGLHEVQDTISYEWMFAHDASNQGDFGSCVSWALKQFIETALKKHHGIDVSISARALYQMAQAKYEPQWLGTDSGLYAEDALRTLESPGYVLERDCPYPVPGSGMPIADFLKPVPIALVHGDHRLLNFHRVTGTEDPPAVRFEKTHAALDATGCVLMGFNWAGGWFGCGKDRKLAAQPSGGLAGGHEVIGLASSRSRRFTTIRCAWGNDWADRSFAEVPWDVNPEFAPLDVYSATAP